MEDKIMDIDELSEKILEGLKKPLKSLWKPAQKIMKSLL
jgi:hypothetical protein